MQDLATALNRLGTDEAIIVGSGSSVDVVVRAEGVDERHASFMRRHAGVFVRDLDSVGGTFVNGREVRGFVEIRTGDRVRIGSHEMHIGKAIERGRGAGLAVSLVDAVKTVRINGVRSPRNILDHVNVQMEPGAFVGVLGASGSGKSTFIKALAGLVELSLGEVWLDGRPLPPDVLRSDGRIAYLPQDVVIHEQLTPRAALGYIARLKGIANRDADRARTVHDVLERVGLADRGDVPVRQLSGGQRKRVALAAELLGNPGVILLDEATSGLDPATEEEMMRLFRSLAEEGRTVVCITHFPGRLHMCDKLLYMMAGKVVFGGTPKELVQFFGVQTIEDTYSRQRERSAGDWEAAYRRRCGSQPPPLPAGVTNHDINRSAIVPERPKSLMQQTRVLTARYFRLQIADWQNVLLLFAQAPIIGLMVSLVFGSTLVSFAELHAAQTKEVIFVLVVAVLWCAGTASVREIVKEDAILQHESRFGVRLIPYLCSKVALLSALSLAQTFVLLLVVRNFTKLTGDFPDQYVVLGSSAVSGVALGLMVSSFAGTSERAMTVLPVLLIAQAIFSGGLSRLSGIVKALAQLLFPAYWSLDGLRATFSTDLANATYPGAPGHYQPPILGPGGPLLIDLLALGSQAAVLLALAYAFLELKLNGALPHARLDSALAWIRQKTGRSRRVAGLPPEAAPLKS